MVFFLIRPSLYSVLFFFFVKPLERTPSVDNAAKKLLPPIRQYQPIQTNMSSSTGPHPLALPPTFSPDTLDALTELSIVLTNVRAGIQSSTGITTGATPGANGQQQQQLSFKDVPGATDSLKHKLQRARTQVRALPDMNRTIEEQSEEIKELETRIEAQRTLLARLRDGGSKPFKDDAADDKMDI